MSFWETETPVTATTGKNEPEYFPQAEKLTISRPSWTNDRGETKRGKTVVLDLEAVKGCPEAVQIVKAIAGSL